MKWTKELGLTKPEFWWERVANNVVRKVTDVKLRWFQYRIVHRIISTNTYLYKIGIKQSSLCSLCMKEPETISHLFCFCKVTTNFWEEVFKWIRDVTGKHIAVTECDKIFGFEYVEIPILNHIIILPKYHIYRQKMNNLLPSIVSFKNDILTYYKMEKYNYTCADKIKVLQSRWGDFIHTFDVIN